MQVILGPENPWPITTTVMSFSKFPIGYANLISIITSPPVGKLRCLFDRTPSIETTKVFVDFLYFVLSFWISINRFLLQNLWNMLAKVIHIFFRLSCPYIFFLKLNFEDSYFNVDKQNERTIWVWKYLPMVSLSRIFRIGLPLVLILTW